MRSIVFPYSLYKGSYLPIIPLEVQHRGEWIDQWAFVDSGATYSLFSARDARSMGIDLRGATFRNIVVGDGDFIPASFVLLPVRIGDVVLEVEIGFSEKLGFEFNLLGRKDVFEKFRVCFSDAERKVIFHLSENSKE